MPLPRAALPRSNMKCSPRAAASSPTCSPPRRLRLSRDLLQPAAPPQLTGLSLTPAIHRVHFPKQNLHLNEAPSAAVHFFGVRPVFTLRVCSSLAGLEDRSAFCQRTPQPGPRLHPGYTLRAPGPSHRTSADTDPNTLTRVNLLIAGGPKGGVRAVSHGSILSFLRTKHL